jgi:FkbM family methyltransferase
MFLVKRALKSHIRRTLKGLSLRMGDYTTITRAIESAAAFNQIPDYVRLLLALPDEKIRRLLPHITDAKSQIGQDLFVLSTLNFKRNGYFVEFGATNGVNLSNSFILEKSFGWTGILAEPAKVWHDALKQNRGCHIETDCVWRDSTSTLEFNEVMAAEHSTVNLFSDSDFHASLRKHGLKYRVATISLTDLLNKYSAPDEIDFLSIDTEGSEFDILSTFDFDRYRFKVITCEHNHTANKEKIHKLLSSHGYQRKLEDISDFDDWYIRPDLT